MISLNDAPADLRQAIKEFWPEGEWNHAAQIAHLESGFNPFATNDTRTTDAPCGTIIGTVDGVDVSAEWSIGYFQINACNLPDGWNPNHLFNTRHNAGTAHHMWATRGWRPWYFSARQLGLL